MSGIRELHTRWDGVAGAPYWTTLRATTAGVKTADDFRNAWATFLSSMAGSLADQLDAVILSEVTVIESTTGQLIDTETVSGTTIPMTNTSPMLPRATQGLIQWRTDTIISGRRVKGRTFLPGFCENANTDDGDVESTVVTGVQGALNTFMSSMGGELVVYSRTHLSGGAVTTVRFWNEWAVLRSRRD